MVLFMKATNNVQCILFRSGILAIWSRISNFSFGMLHFPVNQTNTVKTDELFGCRKYGYTESIDNDRSIKTVLKQPLGTV